MKQNLEIGDLVSCGCVGCGTLLTVVVAGKHPGKCTECAKGEPHRHGQRGVYIAIEQKLPWEKKDAGSFVSQG